MESERREQQRFSLKLRTRISRCDETGETVIDTVAANISGGGAFLITDHPFPMASRLKLEFLVSLEELQQLKFVLSTDTLRRLTGSQLWVTTSGIVIRKEGDGVGIIFDTNYQLTPLNSSPEL